MNKVSTEGINRAASAFLVGVGAIQIIASLRSSHVEENAIGAAVCIIAFLHYMWMEGANDTKMLELRYSDWIVTCPLLLWELHRASEQEDKSSLVWPIIFVITMLGLGFASKTSADSKSRQHLFIGGCVAFALCILSFVPNIKKNHALVYTFFGIWALYPLVSYSNNNTALSILDMISKGAFGLYIATNSMS